MDPSILSSSSIVHVWVCPAPQIISKQQMSPFELSSCCSCHVFSYFFRLFLTLEMSEMSAIFQVHNQNNSCLNLHERCIFEIISSLNTNSSKFGHQKLVMVNYACDFSQSESGKYFESIIISFNTCTCLGIYRYRCIRVPKVFFNFFSAKERASRAPVEPLVSWLDRHFDTYGVYRCCRTLLCPSTISSCFVG